MWIILKNNTYYFDEDNIKDLPDIYKGSVLFDIATKQNGKYEYIGDDTYKLIGISDNHLLPVMHAWHKYAPAVLIENCIPDKVSELKTLRNALIFYGFKIPAETVNKKINNIILADIAISAVISLFALLVIFC